MVKRSAPQELFPPPKKQRVTKRIHYDGTSRVALQLSESDLDVVYIPRIAGIPDNAFNRLNRALNFVEHEVHHAWKTTKTPRLLAAYGDDGVEYTVGGSMEEASPWVPILLVIKKAVEAVCKCQFNFVLANKFEDGDQFIKDEKFPEGEIDDSAPCVVVSFGETRDFTLKHTMHLNNEEHQGSWANIYSLSLKEGSALVMNSPTNSKWFHSVPKCAASAVTNPRISLTFRKQRKEPISSDTSPMEIVVGTPKASISMGGISMPKLAKSKPSVVGKKNPLFKVVKATKGRKVPLFEPSPLFPAKSGMAQPAASAEEAWNALKKLTKKDGIFASEGEKAIYIKEKLAARSEKFGTENTYKGRLEMRKLRFGTTGEVKKTPDKDLRRAAVSEERSLTPQRKPAPKKKRPRERSRSYEVEYERVPRRARARGRRRSRRANNYESYPARHEKYVYSDEEEEEYYYRDESPVYRSRVTRVYRIGRYADEYD